MDWSDIVEEQRRKDTEIFLKWQNEKRQKYHYKVQPVCMNCRFVEIFENGRDYYLCKMDIESIPKDYDDYVDENGTCDCYKE